MQLTKKHNTDLDIKIEPSEQFKSLCSKYGVDIHNIDFETLMQKRKDYDSDKSFLDNEVIPLLKTLSELDKMELVSLEQPNKKELEALEGEQSQRELLEKESKTEEIEHKIIEDIKNSKTPELDKYYKDLEVYIKVLKNTPDITACIIIGDAGIGKTTYIKKRFGGNDILLSGHLTAKELYMTYLNNPYAHIIIDDPSSIYSNNDSIGLLLQATQTEPIRTIHWHSSTLKVPKKTPFYGKTTIIQNGEIENEILESRCLIKHLNFDFNTKIRMFYEFVKIIGCPAEVVDEIRKFRNYGDAVNRRISFRTIQKLFAFYKNDKNWKNKVLETIGIREDKNKIYDLVLKLDKKYSSIKDMEEEFIRETKMSRASFFALRSELNLTRGYRKIFCS